MTSPPPTPDRTPDSLLHFWQWPLTSADEATAENWRNRNLTWHIGPFARNTEDRAFVQVQRDWCEQLHREGERNFFSHPSWQSPRGVLARILVLDQFPRCVYRGTPLAYANDELTGRMAANACERGWDTRELGLVERLWFYLALCHSEDWEVQRRSVDRYSSWSQDLIEHAPTKSRKVNRYVSWSILKASIEHSEVLLLYGRFPHRNSILRRQCTGGELRYLNDPMRPLWTFTQPPNPRYFSLLAAMYRCCRDLDEKAIRRDTVAEFQVRSGLSAAATADRGALMDVFDLPAVEGETVSFDTLYRHLLLTEKSADLEAAMASPFMANLFEQVAPTIMKELSSRWPPRSPKKSLWPHTDAEKLNAIIMEGA